MGLYIPIMIIKAGSVVISSLLFVFYFRLKKKKDLKKARIILIILVICGVLFWMNMGIFRSTGEFSYNWEQFHYFLGTKYFPELGYDGLYVAALKANAESIPDFYPPPTIRDLRTDKETSYALLYKHQTEVRARFSEQRWAAFVKDVQGFPYRKSIFLDHGYNPTPPFTFVARLFTAWLPVTEFTKALLSFIDILIVIACCVLVARYFNLERAALFSVLLGIGYVYYFGYLGGSILRFDWFLAMTLTLCFFQKKQFEFAGMSFSYMVMARVFPVVLLAGLAVYWIRKKRFGPALKFSKGFLIMSLILLIIGSFAGRGIHAYPENYVNLSNFSIATSGLGIQYFMMTSWENLFGQNTDMYSRHSNSKIIDNYKQTQEQNLPVIIIVTALSLLFVFFSIANARNPVEALVMSMGIIFCIATLNFYYWVMLVFAVFFRPKFAMKSMMAVNILNYIWLCCYLVLVYVLKILSLYSALPFMPLIIMLTVFFIMWYWPVFRQNAQPLLAEPLKRLLKKKG